MAGGVGVRRSVFGPQNDGKQELNSPRKDESDSVLHTNETIMSGDESEKWQQVNLSGF